MFISKIDEVLSFGFNDFDWDLVFQSNEGFSSIVGKYIKEPLDRLYCNLIKEYEETADTNAIARFIIKRLSLANDEIKKHPKQIGVLKNQTKNYIPNGIIK